MKYFGWSLEEITWGMSYANMVMMAASVPKTNDKGEETSQEPPKEITGADLFAKWGRKKSV